MNNFHRFKLTFGYIAHLWKSTTRQDHAELKQIISRYLPNDGIAIDVGAHGGQITRLLSSITKSGLVIAIEPSGYTRSILRPALWFRRCRNVIVVAAALGSRFSTMLIHTPLKQWDDMGYGLSNLVDGGVKSIIEPVAVITLDSLVEQLGLKRVDFIKADIEGYEAEFIRGAGKMLKQFRPVILMEMDDDFLRRAGATLEILWKEMLALNYAPHFLREGVLSVAVPKELRKGDIFWVPNEYPG